MIAEAHDGLFAALNSLVGRSWAFDSLVALAVDNILVKAGPVGAAFFYAWYRADRDGGQERRRGILLVTVLTLFVIAPATAAVSGQVLAPRPFVYSEPTYALRDGGLVAAQPGAFRLAGSGDINRRVGDLHEGVISENDLGSFPSDHAALFTALSLGILLASRVAGLFALAWTFLVILAGRVAIGMHWPVDIAAGAAIGAAILLGVQAISGRFARRPVLAGVGLAKRYPGLTAAFLFLMIVEVANAMQTMKALMGIAAAIAGRLS